METPTFGEDNNLIDNNCSVFFVVHLIDENRYLVYNSNPDGGWARTFVMIVNAPPLLPACLPLYLAGQPADMNSNEIITVIGPFLPALLSTLPRRAAPTTLSLPTATIPAPCPRVASTSRAPACRDRAQAQPQPAQRQVLSTAASRMEVVCWRSILPPMRSARSAPRSNGSCMLSPRQTCAWEKLVWKGFRPPLRSFAGLECVCHVL
ncbi:hypothetical protein F5883DRAFT_585350 [Diaporthe sp. PMI_573]|nr:hypothetical protein F5883DRAFT_585350 [Diaporthaceae sp. PMI_573]